ncbi:MAG TPA: hypothetical protein VL970_10235 [Candidatus Acidoferrales bacterium]|nr:hypothetical protein [Candidatus Acidoferrales bacterium]
MLRPSATTTVAEEKSLDFRLFCGFHLWMIITLAAHYVVKLGIVAESVIAGTAAVVAIIVSVRDRLKHHWHWPGARMRDGLWAFAAALLVAFFFGAAWPGRSPLDPKLFPWYAMGLNFLVFAVLSGLHIVCQTEKEFQSQCGAAGLEMPARPARPVTRSWKTAIMTAFQAYFLVIWIAGVYSFWKFNMIYHRGSPVATSTQTEQLSSHGRIVFISLHDWKQLNVLQWALILGIPSVFVIGWFLHFVARVKVFSRTAD